MTRYFFIAKYNRGNLQSVNFYPQPCKASDRGFYTDPKQKHTQYIVEWFDNVVECKKAVARLPITTATDEVSAFLNPQA